MFRLFLDTEIHPSFLRQPHNYTVTWSDIYSSAQFRVNLTTNLFLELPAPLDKISVLDEHLIELVEVDVVQVLDWAGELEGNSGCVSVKCRVWLILKVHHIF